MNHTSATTILAHSSELFRYSTFANFEWILSESCNVERYHFKNDTAQTILGEKKKDYASGRDYLWTLSSKKPHRLKYLLKEFEETVESQRIVRIKWLKDDTVALIFNSGVIAYISINLSTGDVTHIEFDRYLKDKLVSPRISDGNWVDNSTHWIHRTVHFIFSCSTVFMSNLFCVCCYNDPQFSLIYYSKPAFRKVYRKLTDLEPKFTSINLPGSYGRRLPRKLCVNKTGDVVRNPRL